DTWTSMNLPIAIRGVEGLLRANRRAAGLAMVFALGAAASGCGKSSANAPAGEAATVPVQVRVEASAKIPVTTEYLSILKSRHWADINRRVEGQFTKIPFTSGDRVREG